MLSKGGRWVKRWPREQRVLSSPSKGPLQLPIPSCLLFVSQSSHSNHCWIVSWERRTNTALNRKITVVLKEGWKKGWGEMECLYMPFISSVIWTSDSVQDEMMRFNVDHIRTVQTWPGNVYSWKFTSLSVSACFSLVWEDIWHIHISNNWNSCCSLQLLFVYNNI